jgi:selenide,water dikinase
MNTQPIPLTGFSHGSGCGCKISPRILDAILEGRHVYPSGKILVGNDSSDDAAVYDLGNGRGLVATTDFFMPVVDDPVDLGRIAAANAISDIYAMGAKPVLALSLLGWPVDLLPPEMAGKVIEGASMICQQAGIALAGGHSVDSREPFFGLAVNGLAPLDHIKRNDTARPGNLLFLTKPLGTGILTTAQKKGIVKKNDLESAIKHMSTLNRAGEFLGELKAVCAMTDVTGFGLLGHLREMAEGSGCSAILDFTHIPVMQGDMQQYMDSGAVPGGSSRNWESYGKLIGPLSEFQRIILSDPQTSGGLLIALDPAGLKDFEELMMREGLAEFLKPVGELTERGIHVISIR